MFIKGYHEKTICKHFQIPLLFTTKNTPNGTQKLNWIKKKFDKISLGQMKSSPYQSRRITNRIDSIPRKAKVMFL